MKKINLKINYTPEQRSAISEIDYDNTNYIFSDSIVERNGEFFAIFGNIAQKLFVDREKNVNTIKYTLLHDTYDDTIYEYVPLVLFGKMLSYGDEYSDDRLVYLMRCLQRFGKKVESPQWGIGKIQNGWVFTKELKLSNDEIKNKIMDEYDSSMLLG